MNPLIQFRKATPVFVIAFALACFGLLPTTQAADETRFNSNTGEGDGALQSVTTGSNNTGLGAGALFSLTTGLQNTATGAQALKNNTDGIHNTADGFQALGKNTIGGDNAATGWRALFQNTTGSFNTADGFGALFSNTTGTFNTASGLSALTFNTTGGSNTAAGGNALLLNTTGSNNTADGTDALLSNTTGVANTAVGGQALASMTAGTANTAIGNSALDNLTTGSFNIVVGQGGANITTASNVIAIGSDGANTSSTTWIGNIFGVTTISGTTAPVIVSNTGQLGTVPSSERFKKDIATMDKASDAILSLRPVTFHYKTDTKGTPQFGLIAEEVAKVNPALVLPDKEGRPYTVRYDAVNAMLLNEFLKEHQKVQKLEAALAAVNERLKAQDAKIDKVNAKVELTKPAPQTVLNQ